MYTFDYQRPADRAAAAAAFKGDGVNLPEEAVQETFNRIPTEETP